MVVGGQAVRRQNVDPRTCGAHPFPVAGVDDHALDDVGLEQVLEVAVLGNEDLACVDVVAKHRGALVKDTGAVCRSHPNLFIQVLFDAKHIV